jgi:DNA-binding transcriptional MerR regulator
MLGERDALTISEAAEALSVSVSWMRLGERCGTLPRARRTSGGWRMYAPEGIERLRRLGVGERKKRLAGHSE